MFTVDNHFLLLLLVLMFHLSGQFSVVTAS